MNKREAKPLRGPVPRHKEDDQVVYIDEKLCAPDHLLGHRILCEDLPIGTRVIYAKPPHRGPGQSWRRHSLRASTTRSTASRSTPNFRPACA